MSTTSSPPVALITAGTAGLGAATALLFARSGIRVVVNYHADSARSELLLKELESVSSLPASLQINYHAIKADLSKRDEINRLVEETVRVMRRLDVVFSNGGWTRIRNILEMEDNLDEEDWDRCFNMNVKSHLWLMAAARRELEKTEGAFVTTASLAGVKVSGSSLVSSFLLGLLLKEIGYTWMDWSTDGRDGMAGLFGYQGCADTPCQGAGYPGRSED